MHTSALPCTHPLCNALSPFADANFVPRSSVQSGLADLKRVLTEHNYTKANIARVSGRKALLGFDAAELAVCGGQRCPPLKDDMHAAPLDVLMQLFLRVNLDVYVDVGHLRRKAVERILGRRAVAALLELGVLAEAKHGRPVIHSNVQLVPTDDPAHIATDYHQVATEFWFDRGLEPVMALGGDTDGLVYGAPRHVPGQRLLDLCTGSGVQAIVAALHYAEDVTLVDLNPRAVRFARFNLALNGISPERSRVYEGDLYEALPPGTARFDVITANPPYLPQDEPGRFQEDGTLTGGGGALRIGDAFTEDGAQEKTMAMFGAGGALGHRLTRAVVRGAGRWLTAHAPDAAVRIVATIYNTEHYEGWLQEWWGHSTDDAAEFRMHTGNVWSREVLARRMGQGRAGVYDGCNALIWIRRRLPSTTPAADAAAPTTLFWRTKLHSFMWQALNSETGMREVVQYWLRMEDARRLLPDYSLHIDEEGRARPTFRTAWDGCTHAQRLSHLEDHLDLRVRTLPRKMQDELMRCVNGQLAAQFGAKDDGSAHPRVKDEV